MTKPFILTVVLLLLVAAGVVAVWVRSGPERERRRQMQESARRLKDTGEQLRLYSNDRVPYPRTVTTAPATTAPAP